VPTDAIADRTDRADGVEPDVELMAALRALPEKQRRSVAYHYLGGLPYAEIASIVGGTAEAARRAAADGVAALRRCTFGAPSQTKERSAG
jgi:DNA-directed RNA polymerase specialized sigma24 family protein